MKIALIIYSIVYLLLELAFRSRLLDTAGIIADGVTIENIEIIGRLISSLGFAILVVSMIKLNKASIIAKVCIYSCAYSLSLGAFFILQKFAVDYIVNIVPQETKEKAFYLQLHKEAIYYNDMKPDGLPYNKNNAESKVFLANFPLLNINNNDHVNYLVNQKDSLIKSSATNYANYNEDAVLSEWLYSTGVMNKQYDKFKSAQNSINRKFNSFESDSKEAFDLMQYYKKKSFREYRASILDVIAIKNDGSSTNIVNAARNGRFKNIGYDQSGNIYVEKAKEFYAEYGMDTGVTELPIPRYVIAKRFLGNVVNKIETQEEFEDFSFRAKNLLKRQIYDSLEFKLGKIDSKLGYKFSDSVLSTINGIASEVCTTRSSIKDLNIITFNPRFNSVEGWILFKYKRNSSSLDYIKSLEINRDLLDGKNYFVCNYGEKINEIQKLIVTIADAYNKSEYGFDRDYENAENFYKTKHFREKLRSELKYKGMNIPLNFNSSSYSQFKKYYKKALLEKSQKTLTEIVSVITGISYNDYIKEYGYVPVNISEYDLLNLPAVKSKLKADAPFLFDDKGNIVFRYRTDSLNKTSTMDKLPTIKNNVVREQKKFLDGFALDPASNQEVLDTYAKSLVVPPFVLFVSTIMIVINLINLFWRLFPLKSFKYKLAINSIISILLVALPLSLKNIYVSSGYYEVLKEKESPRLFISTTIWLQNTNGAFEKLNFADGYIQPLFDLFEYKILLRETTTGEEKARMYMLSKKVEKYF